mmetsp:Transcript_11344/g.21641  ORF Transcript_11344/g.21641 Transcript_11344/m.21641 type:complete len:248 (+) Transcript_11344:861-1604(+)
MPFPFANVGRGTLELHKLRNPSWYVPDLPTEEEGVVRGTVAVRWSISLRGRKWELSVLESDVPNRPFRAYTVGSVEPTIGSKTVFVCSVTIHPPGVRRAIMSPRWHPPCWSPHRRSTTGRKRSKSPFNTMPIPKNHPLSSVDVDVIFTRGPRIIHPYPINLPGIPSLVTSRSEIMSLPCAIREETVWTRDPPRDIFALHKSCRIIPSWYWRRVMESFFGVPRCDLPWKPIRNDKRDPPRLPPRPTAG